MDWCLYEREVENYPRCIEIWSEYNEYAASIVPDLVIDVSERCQLPPPPEPLQPLDCNDLGTCPTDQCELVPATLYSHDSHGQSRILFVDYVYVQGDLPSGGHDACRDYPHLHQGKCEDGFALDRNSICKPVRELIQELCIYDEKKRFVTKYGGYIFGGFGMLFGGIGGGFVTVGNPAGIAAGATAAGGVGGAIGWASGTDIWDWFIKVSCR